MRLRIVECSRSHLDKCVEHKLFGSDTERFTEWRSGDRIAFAVEGVIAALAKVRGLPYEEKVRIWPDGVYPFRIPIEIEQLFAAGQEPSIAGPVEQALRQAWGEEVAAGIEARRPVSGPQADRIISLLLGAKPMKPEEKAPTADTVPPPATADTAPAEEKVVLRNCLNGSGCGQAWNDLVKTELADVRFCTRCERAVYLCRDGDRLLESLKKDRCVAVAVP